MAQISLLFILLVPVAYNWQYIDSILDLSIKPKPNMKSYWYDIHKYLMQIFHICSLMDNPASHQAAFIYGETRQPCRGVIFKGGEPVEKYRPPNKHGLYVDNQLLIHVRNSSYFFNITLLHFKALPWLSLEYCRLSLGQIPFRCGWVKPHTLNIRSTINTTAKGLSRFSIIRFISKTNYEYIIHIRYSFQYYPNYNSFLCPIRPSFHKFSSLSISSNDHCRQMQLLTDWDYNLAVNFTSYLHPKVSDAGAFAQVYDGLHKQVELSAYKYHTRVNWNKEKYYVSEYNPTAGFAATIVVHSNISMRQHSFKFEFSASNVLSVYRDVYMIEDKSLVDDFPCQISREHFTLCHNSFILKTSPQTHFFNVTLIDVSFGPNTDICREEALVINLHVSIYGPAVGRRFCYNTQMISGNRLSMPMSIITNDKRDHVNISWYSYRHASQRALVKILIQISRCEGVFIEAPQLQKCSDPYNVSPDEDHFSQMFTLPSIEWALPSKMDQRAFCRSILRCHRLHSTNSLTCDNSARNRICEKTSYSFFQKDLDYINYYIKEGHSCIVLQRIQLRGDLEQQMHNITKLSIFHTYSGHKTAFKMLYKTNHHLSKAFAIKNLKYSPIISTNFDIHVSQIEVAFRETFVIFASQDQMTSSLSSNMKFVRGSLIRSLELSYLDQSPMFHSYPSLLDCGYYYDKNFKVRTIKNEDFLKLSLETKDQCSLYLKLVYYYYSLLDSAFAMTKNITIFLGFQNPNFIYVDTAVHLYKYFLLSVMNNSCSGILNILAQPHRVNEKGLGLEASCNQQLGFISGPKFSSDILLFSNLQNNFSWMEAKEFCKSIPGYHLLDMRSPEDDILLMKILRHTHNTYLVRNLGCWFLSGFECWTYIGLKLKEKEWQWTKDNLTLKTFNWAKNIQHKVKVHIKTKQISSNGIFSETTLNINASEERFIEPKAECAVARLNPFLNSFEWHAINCEKKNVSPFLICQRTHAHEIVNLYSIFFKSPDYKANYIYSDCCYEYKKSKPYQNKEHILDMKRKIFSSLNKYPVVERRLKGHFIEYLLLSYFEMFPIPFPVAFITCHFKLLHENNNLTVETRNIRFNDSFSCPNFFISFDTEQCITLLQNVSKSIRNVSFGKISDGNVKGIQESFLLYSYCWKVFKVQSSSIKCRWKSDIINLEDLEFKTSMAVNITHMFIKCKANNFRCFKSSKQCISTHTLQDGIFDCPLGEDENADAILESGIHMHHMHFPADGKAVLWEKLSPKHLNLSLIIHSMDKDNKTISSIKDCMTFDLEVNSSSFGTVFRCSEFVSSCFELHHLCLYDTTQNGHLKYCPNGENLKICSTFACSGYFKCHLSYCIPVWMVCNWRPDCLHGEDEENCLSENITYPGYFRCKGGLVLHPLQVCNYEVDCNLSEEDELGCNNAVCVGNCLCFGHSKVCNSSRTIDANGYIHLKVLKVNSDELQIKDGHNLISLNLSNAGLKVLGKDLMTEKQNIVFLDVSMNSLTFLASNTLNLPQLQHLILFGNKISKIDPNNFVGVNYIEKLDLSFQNLDLFPIVDFWEMKSLKIINLSNNKISNLNLPNFSKIISLHFIDIRENDIQYVSSVDPNPEIIILSSTENICCVFQNCNKSSLSNMLCMNQNKNLMQALSVIGSILHIFSTPTEIHSVTSASQISSVRFINIFKMIQKKMHFISTMSLFSKLIDVDTTYVHSHNGFKHLACLIAGISQFSSLVLSACTGLAEAISIYRTITSFGISSLKFWQELLLYTSLVITSFLISILPVFSVQYAYSSPVYFNKPCSFLTSWNDNMFLLIYHAIALSCVLGLHIVTMLFTILIFRITLKSEKSISKIGGKRHNLNHSKVVMIRKLTTEIIRVLVAFGLFVNILIKGNMLADSIITFVFPAILILFDLTYFHWYKTFKKRFFG